MTALLRVANTLVASADSEVRGSGFLMRTRSLLWLGDLDQALVNAEQAVSINPAAMTYELRADVRWARGDLAGAIADYTFAIKLRPEPGFFQKRASVYEAAGDPAAAASDRNATAKPDVRAVSRHGSAAAGSCQECGATLEGSATCWACGAKVS